ncbi:DUF3060 domain-containing protein [Mycolicibacterium confluentis]|uniref:Uncharacterized protein n=1 Tax=Mycolicibacterium confluentis TaxID=28047 RepID=A0A7I7Y103_9MYCO|nr:DUF3060 domain-containing protein [Mycolicibacterium confluentis]MCV7320203.1 DUF3060 domain-containing protein [Mycolicibacterium confluentis]ORV34726.1 hypothetical protein AWB99_03810 [Mycolicibacterium confluentis]BBZ35239.1 hypothetical protein MCNF_38440 [Mycolicibacterium confluentis]
MRRPVVLIVGAIPALALGLIGCGSDEPAATTQTSGVSAPTGFGRTLHYSSFGTKADIDCGDRRPLDVSGSNNILTVTGTCSSVTISGADNRLRVTDIADSIVVTGLNNTVLYENGEPEITASGTGNDIRRA